MTAIPSDIIKVISNKKPVVFELAPVNLNNTLMIPMNSTPMVIGANSVTDAAKKTITVTRGKNTLTMRLNNKKALLNGKAITLSNAPTLINSNIYLPIKAICEKLKINYKEDGKMKCLYPVRVNIGLVSIYAMKEIEIGDYDE
jgi:hypothetical protein